MDEIPIAHEMHLGNPKAVSEHLVATMGMSSAIDNGIGRMVKRLPEEKEDRLQKINSMLLKSRKNIANQSENIFNGGKIEEGPSHPKGLDPIHETIFEHAFNPEYLKNKLSEQFGNLAEHAPDLTASLAQTIGGGIQHLESKRPNTGKPLPLDADKELSQMQHSHFNKHVNIVDNPMQLFRHIKDGTVEAPHIEAMNTVYPNLMQNIKESLMDKMTEYIADHEPNSVPYKTRLALTHVLGQNLDSTMTQQGISANQQALMQNQMEQGQKQMAQQKVSKVGIGKMKTDSEETSFQQSQSRGR